MWAFSYFQYGVRSSSSTADLTTVVPDRIAKAFKRYVATQDVTLNKPRLLTMFGTLVFFTKLSCMQF